jgi:RHS repeat-associated protein
LPWFFSSVCNAADRLIGVSLLNQQPEGKADTVEFGYNGLDQRVRIIEKHGSNVLSDKTFLWAEGQIAEERNEDGGTISKRFFGYGEQVVLGSVTGNFFYTTDHLGSIREMVASDGVSVRAKYDYDLWGRQTKLAGDLDATFGFTGFYVSRSTGLDLTWFRAYSAVMGRWLSREPLGESADFSLYRYVANDIIGLIDLSGFSGGKPKPQPRPNPTPIANPIDASKHWINDPYNRDVFCRENPKIPMRLFLIGVGEGASWLIGGPSSKIKNVLLKTVAEANSRLLGPLFEYMMPLNPNPFLSPTPEPKCDLPGPKPEKLRK